MNDFGFKPIIVMLFTALSIVGMCKVAVIIFERVIRLFT